MNAERARLVALGIATSFLLPFVLPFVPFGFVLFVPFMIWYGAWWLSLRLEERHERKKLDRDYEELLDKYNRDR